MIMFSIASFIKGYIMHGNIYASHPTLLIILDGFGYSPSAHYNAILNAYKPTFDYLLETFPHTLLTASGTAVGLLDNQQGNSEVGHLTIGSGRVIEQNSTRIEKSIDDGSFFSNKILRNNLDYLHKTGKKLHIMGLLSDGGIHSNTKTLYALLKAAHQHHISAVVIHAFLDGRDVPPQSATRYLEQLDKECTQYHNVHLGTIHGRFYAMDRDDNWLRTEQTYRVITEKQTITFAHWRDALTYYYHEHITDEFIPPTQLDSKGIVQEGDAVIFFNYRADRTRQLTDSFVDPHFQHFQRKKIALARFITLTDYDLHSTSIDIAFPSMPVANTLKDVLAHAGKTIFSIAETEKYIPITYFFNGYKNSPIAHETCILIPSLPRSTYVQFPCMSAQKITETVAHSLRTQPSDFYLINYANADMVGHSGNFNATVKAIECLDKQLQILVQAVRQCNGTLYITADHGNAEDKYDPITRGPKTSHTSNPVYFIMMNNDTAHKKISLPLKGLADIAPFILKNMHLAIPPEMNHVP